MAHYLQVPSTTSVIFGGLDNGGQYHFAIFAYNSAGGYGPGTNSNNVFPALVDPMAGAGERSFFTYDRFGLTEAMTGAVNVGTGNLEVVPPTCPCLGARRSLLLLKVWAATENHQLVTLTPPRPPATPIAVAHPPGLAFPRPLRDAFRPAMLERRDRFGCHSSDAGEFRVALECAARRATHIAKENRITNPTTAMAQEGKPIVIPTTSTTMTIA